MKHLLFAMLILLPLSALADSGGTAGSTGDDYPTAARADYVLACMNVNGGTQEALRRCSCSIDVIATILPYSEYDHADTVLRMQHLTGGYLAEEFRSDESKNILRNLREAQAEAEVRCF